MTIDAGKLREAIDYYQMRFQEIAGVTSAEKLEWSKVLLDAASAYAASLPREVEIERWAVLNAAGDICGICLSEDAARAFLCRDGDQAVRLTGTALLPPRDKD